MLTIVRIALPLDHTVAWLFHDCFEKFKTLVFIPKPQRVFRGHDGVGRALPECAKNFEIIVIPDYNQDSVTGIVSVGSN